MTMNTNIKLETKNTKKGITILYALFGILLFTIVGVVIFNSASANYIRSINEHDYEQAYLTVSSATSVFTDSIVGDKVTYTITQKKKGDAVIEETSIDKIEWTYVDVGKTNPIKNSLLKIVQQRHASSTVSIENKYTISADFDDKDITMEDVYVTAVLNNYDIIATFSNWNGVEEEKPKNYFYLIATIPFVRDKDDYNPVVEAVETTEEEDTDGSIIDVTTTTYKVEWDAGNVSIIRGETNE